MIEILIIYFVFFLLAIPIALIALCWGSIKLHLQKMWYVRKGLGLLCIVDNASIGRYYWRRLKGEVDINGFLYKIYPHFTIRVTGIPTIYFYENDSKPIDMLHRARDTLISPEMLSIVVKKARASGSISQDKQNPMLFYLVLGACIFGLLAMAISFNMSTTVNDMAKQVASIAAAMRGG